MYWGLNGEEKQLVAKILYCYMPTVAGLVCIVGDSGFNLCGVKLKSRTQGLEIT